MPHGRRPRSGIVETSTTFATTTCSVSWMYLTTHSVTVTVIGAVASAVVTCWGAWLLPCKGSRHDTSHEL